MKRADYQTGTGRRVAIVMLSDGLGGTERRFLSIATALQKTGQFMPVIFTTFEHIATQKKNPLFVPSISIPYHELGSPFSLSGFRCGKCIPTILARMIRLLAWLINWIWLSLGLLRALLTFRPDIVHIVLEHSILCMWPITRFLRVPMVLSVVGTEVRERANYSRSMPAGWLQSMALKTIASQSGTLDVLGPDLLKIIAEEQLAQSDKCLLTGSFVEAERFTPAAKKEPWVVFAHRLVSGKNPELFVKAVGQIQNRHPTASFFLFGSGPLEPALRSQISEAGLGHRITMRFLPDVQTVLSKSMVFVCIQDKENYPSRSLLEAMACGNAAIATDVGFTNLLVNERTGIRVPGNPDALASAIDKMLSNPETTMEYGRNARELIVNEFSAESYLRRLMAIYNRNVRVE